jgi:uncharacterized protein (TIGR00369 family)
MKQDQLEARIQAVYDSQQMLKTMKAHVSKVSHGEVQFEMPFNPHFTQQHGYLQAGAIATLIDNACGYAAYTVIPPSAEILTVEFKINYIAPAKGEKFIATGKAVKSGRTLVICTGEAVAIENGESKLIAIMQATMMVMK